MKIDDWEEPLELMRDVALMAKEVRGIEITIVKRYVQLDQVFGCPLCRKEFAMISTPRPVVVHCPYCGGQVKLTLAQYPQVFNEPDRIIGREPLK